MERTLQALNELEEAKLFNRYAIGGAVAALFYVEPFETEDLDIFLLIAPDAPPLAPLTPIYDELRRRGCREDGPYIIVEGVPVQFLPSWNPLIEEAVSQAREVVYLSARTRVIGPEHLAAIMIQTGRAKDRARFALLREAGVLDLAQMSDILSRHGLEAESRSWLS